MTQGLQCQFCYQVHLNQMEDRACSCQCHQPIPAAVEKANSLQVGKTIACGHCEPEKYAEGLKQAEAAIPGYVCECVCHSKPQPAKEWWEESFDEFFEKLPNKEQVILQGNGSWDFTNYFKEATKALASRIAAQSEKKGRGDAVDFIMRESMIEPDFSPHADYIIPFKVLEAARSSEEGKTEL